MNTATQASTCMEPQVILLVDDDEGIREGLAAALEREGRTIITCSDIESAEIVIEHTAVSHIVSDVRLSGRFAVDGLDFINHARKHRVDTRIIVMSGSGSPEMSQEAMQRGAIGFLDKPFDIAQLERLLATSSRKSEAHSHLVRVPNFDEILAAGDIQPYFQPILDLKSGKVHGFEALTRLPGGEILSNPEILFDYAGRKMRVPELENACLERTIPIGKTLVDHGKLLFVNLHPLVFSEGKAFAERFLSVARGHGMQLDHLVLEITEQASIEDSEKSMEAIDLLAAAGIQFAFDDVGVSYSHLMHIHRVKPRYLKISRHFGAGFESDATKIKIVRNIAALARDFGSEIVLEGVETEATMLEARALGIRYVQGYLFGRPAPVEDSLALCQPA